MMLGRAAPVQVIQLILSHGLFVLEQLPAAVVLLGLCGVKETSHPLTDTRRAKGGVEEVQCMSWLQEKESTNA